MSLAPPPLAAWGGAGFTVGVAFLYGECECQLVAHL
jgi:hypothetical protein